MEAITNTFSAIWGAIRSFFTKLRRLIGLGAQGVAQRDQLYALKVQTERLGTAAVESSTYASWEMQALRDQISAVDDRLAKMERDLAELRQLLKEHEPSRL